jgi:hypothetical protein
VSVRLRALEGVEGVKVSLNEGTAAIQLKEGNDLPLERVHKVVAQGGFTPRRARITARAEVRQENGRLRLFVAGTKDSYEIAETSAVRRADLETLAGRRLLVEGLIDAPRDGSAPSIELAAAKPVQDRP